MVPGFAPETPLSDLDALWQSGALDWLREGLKAGAPIASVCSAAFILGEAGLLDGRRCTTHWNYTAMLQERYPAARVVDTALFTHDSGVTTSAGIASGIDMALSLIERDQGPLFTARVARELVVYLRRNGAQGQMSIYLEYRTHLHPGVHRVQDWLIEHVTEKVTLAELAAVANLSARSLSRAFKEATGLTMLQYQQRLRLEHAAMLMHNPKLSLDEVASRCGFEDARHFRRLWKAQFGVAPSAMRVKA
jgi:transcriptional regulator GlxA family with amidase domain